MIRLLPLLLLCSCSHTVVRDGDFVFSHKGNVGILSTSVDNGNGGFDLVTNNFLTVGRQLTEIEASQPGSIEVVTPSGGIVRIAGPISYGSNDEIVGRAIKDIERIYMLGDAIGEVTDGVVDLTKELND